MTCKVYSMRLSMLTVLTCFLQFESFCPLLYSFMFSVWEILRTTRFCAELTCLCVAGISIVGKTAVTHYTSVLLVCDDYLRLLRRMDFPKSSSFHNRNRIEAKVEWWLFSVKNNLLNIYWVLALYQTYGGDNFIKIKNENPQFPFWRHLYSNDRKKKKRHAHARPSKDIVSTLCSLSQIALVSELLVISVSPSNLNPYNETKFGKNPLKPKDSGVPEWMAKFLNSVLFSTCPFKL